jgi:hypothetical protein
MLLAIIVLFEFILTLILLNTSLWLWVLFGLFLYGTLYFYLDEGPINGHRTWEKFKSFRIWKYISPVRYEFTNKEEIQQLDKPCLFIVMPNSTNMPLVYGFGFNGGQMPLPRKKTREKTRQCVYLVPSLLFWIPILRDWLLWSGAVADNGYNTVLDHINSGSCVAYSPNGMGDLLHMELGKLVIKRPGKRIFTFAKENNISIVPVLVYREQERYHILQKRELQTRMFNLFGWPFPFWFFPRIFGTRPPPPMVLYVGNPMRPMAYNDDEQFHNMFFAAIKGMNNCGSDQTMTIKD